MNKIVIILFNILWNDIIYENVVLLLQIEKWAFNSRTVFITYDNIAKLMASKTFIVLKPPQGKVLLLHVFFEMYSPIFFNYNNVHKYNSIILAICKSSIISVGHTWNKTFTKSCIMYPLALAIISGLHISIDKHYWSYSWQYIYIDSYSMFHFEIKFSLNGSKALKLIDCSKRAS